MTAIGVPGYKRLKDEKYFTVNERESKLKRKYFLKF